MKVRELIKMLEFFDDDQEVHLSYPSGDHWRTTVAPKVREVSEGVVEKSDYHGMPKVTEVEYEMELDDGKSEVVILGG